MSDLISRQAAIDALGDAHFKNYGNAIMVIQVLPSAEPKKGKWKEQGVFINEQIEEWQEARCSVCRLFHTTPYKYTFIKYAYCPYCGARMDKDERD
jgi:hypothetical protein